MKRFLFLIAAVAIASIALTSCTSCTNEEGAGEIATPAVEWNVNADVKGDGKIVIGFPTGGVTVAGNAIIGVNSTNVEAVKNGFTLVQCQDIIDNPETYSEKAVEVANEIANGTFFHVDTMEGHWNVDITGYAKVDMIYIVIDEHWPVQPIDSVVVK